MTVKRFIELSWKILECKFLYYEGAKHGLPASTIPKDSEYDALESEYNDLAKELGKDPTASGMVGFNQKRPSCKLVMEHLMSNKSRLMKSDDNSGKDLVEEIAVDIVNTHETYKKVTFKTLMSLGISKEKSIKITKKIMSNLNR